MDYGKLFSDLIREYGPYVALAVVGFAFRKVLPALLSLLQQWETTLAKYAEAHGLATEAEARAFIEAASRQAVLMAEQIAQREDVRNAAEAKRELAFQFINGQAAKAGISVSAQEVYGYIEAAVMAELNKGKAPAPKPAPKPAPEPVEAVEAVDLPPAAGVAPSVPFVPPVKAVPTAPVSLVPTFGD